MKKILMILTGILVFVTIIGISKYNKIITLEEQVITAWSQVENQYQRRYDLIPNLVSTVSGYADHEKETLEGVINARASATKINVDINNALELQEFYNQQSSLTQALSKLMLLQENYPNLKADQVFINLQTSLEGTENRIGVERMRYNEEVKIFNTYVRKFPTNLFASFMGIEAKYQFDSEDGANKAPKVSF